MSVIFSAFGKLCLCLQVVSVSASCVEEKKLKGFD